MKTFGFQMDSEFERMELEPTLYLNGDLNSGPFDEQTTIDHLNTGLVGKRFPP